MDDNSSVINCTNVSFPEFNWPDTAIMTNSSYLKLSGMNSGCGGKIGEGGNAEDGG